MVRGITESDVHTAADEIIGTGERPTVERIRAHLGTGSPNTVTRWLDTWWRSLGNRLEAQQDRLAVPDAPEAVATLAGEWWGLALEHARGVAHEGLAADRATLHAEREALRQDRASFVAEAAKLHDQVDAAVHAERLAATQAAELQRLASQLEGQVVEMARERDAALARAMEAETARQAAEARTLALQDAAKAERESLAQHMRSVEDRAHAEIDRARQETKEQQARLVAATKESIAVEKSLREAADQAKGAANDANRIAGAERARADAFEIQLAKLKDLPAAVEAAIRRNEVILEQQSSRSKKSAARKESREPKALVSKRTASA